MLNFLNESAYFGLALSLAAYFLGWILQKKTKIDAFNPLLISMIVVAAFLALTGMDIGAYQRQTSVLSYLLTPATVCLAVPLYKQLGVLKKNAAAVLVSVAVGLAFGVSSHSLGTAKALEIGEIEGAMSGLALVITGIFTVALSPLFAMIL